MNTALKRWYVVVLAVCALLINEYLVQWILAVAVGHHTLGSGLKDVVKDFSITSHATLTLLRVFPYAGLGAVLVAVSRTRFRDCVAPLFIGGFPGILFVTVWGYWAVFVEYYTGEHVSSTSSLVFVFAPLYAGLAGATGAVAAAILYTPFRFFLKRGKPPQATPPRDGMAGNALRTESSCRSR